MKKFSKIFFDRVLDNMPTERLFRKGIVYFLMLLMVFSTASCAPWGSTRAGAVHSLPTEAKRYEHKVQPGDFIDINLWEEGETKEYKVQVSKTGTISFLFLEEIAVLGLTERELDKHLTSVLAEYYVSPILDVKIREVTYVFGEASSPGVYTFKDGFPLPSQ